MGHEVTKTRRIVTAFALLAIDFVWAGTMDRPFVLDFDCARPDDFPQGELSVTVAHEVLQHGGKAWGDRAVKYDLDRDGNVEYIVPTFCGATGNCRWGIFALSPTGAKALGEVAGTRVYIGSETPWPGITAYEGNGLGKGYVYEYKFQSKRYVETSHRQVEGEENERFLKSMGDPGWSSPARDDSKLGI